jgi:hypothetical protein
MANDIVWYDSDEVSAPVLNNAAGSLDAILYACLVTGFNPKSGLAITVTSNVATVTLAGHGYSNGRMVDIAGAATGSINGRKKITVTGSGSFTFPAPGVSDGAISGSITSKRSPLGWTREANASNASIYKRSDVTATPQMLRVDDSNAGVAGPTFARAVMIEAFTDISTYTGLAPTAAQLSGGQYISKGANNTTAKKWLVVGDSKFFYLFTESIGTSFANSGGLHAAGFGDPVSYRSGDTYGSLLFAANSTDNLSPFGQANSLNNAPNSTGMVLARPYSQIGSAIQAGSVGIGSGSTVMGGGSQTIPAFPSPTDNGIAFAAPMFIAELSSAFGNPIRGYFPGAAIPLGRLGDKGLHGTVLPSVVGTSRDMLLVGLVVPSNASQTGAVAIDVTGPWR